MYNLLMETLCMMHDTGYMECKMKINKIKSLFINPVFSVLVILNVVLFQFSDCFAGDSIKTVIKDILK